MANQTIYPYGTDGELPSNIGIINDLETGGADKALSAEMGKKLNATNMTLGFYLVPLLKKIAYTDDDANSLVDAIEILLSNDELVSIAAVYTQSGMVYNGEPIEDLRSDLVVTASFLSGTTLEISNYSLSGILEEGTSTITVAYVDKTTTFNVTVTDAVFYKNGGVAGRVALKSNITTSNVNQAATINGTTYYFTTSGNIVDTAKKRASYYLFDIPLTAGETYQFELYYTGKSSGETLYIGLPFFDESFRAAGVANSGSAPQNYNDHITDSGWLTPTDIDGKLTTQYVCPSNCVGTRIAFKVQSGGSDINWPASLNITRIAIRKIS